MPLHETHAVDRAFFDGDVLELSLIQRAFDALPHGQRTVLHLAIVDGFTCRDLTDAVVANGNGDVAIEPGPRRGSRRHYRISRLARSCVERQALTLNPVFRGEPHCRNYGALAQTVASRRKDIRGRMVTGAPRRTVAGFVL